MEEIEMVCLLWLMVCYLLGYWMLANQGIDPRPVNEGAKSLVVNGTDPSSSLVRNRGFLLRGYGRVQSFELGSCPTMSCLIGLKVGCNFMLNAVR